MAVYELDGLVAALLGAVHRAAQTSEDQHVDLLNRYFVTAPDGSIVPKTVKLTLPKQGGQVEAELVEVPLITLVPIASMLIKEVEFEFDAYIADISTGPKGRSKPKNAVVPTEDGDTNTTIKIGLGRGWGLGRKRLMKVSVKIQATDPPEGVLRVNGRIVKSLG